MTSSDASGPDVARRPLWLFVGLNAPVAPEARTESLSFVQLTQAVLADRDAAVIVLPLIGPGFDAIEACQRLARLGFAGEVVVRAPTLPNHQIIQRELTLAGAGLKITLTGPEN